MEIDIIEGKKILSILLKVDEKEVKVQRIPDIFSATMSGGVCYKIDEREFIIFPAKKFNKRFPEKEETYNLFGYFLHLMLVTEEWVVVELNRSKEIMEEMNDQLQKIREKDKKQIHD